MPRTGKGKQEDIANNQFIVYSSTTTRTGKPGESQGRKVTGLKEDTSKVAGLPKETVVWGRSSIS